MEIAIIIIQALAMFGVPMLILKLRNVRFFRFIGTIGSAYLFGIIVALIVFAINKGGIDFSLNADVGEIGSHAAIGIAIPLLLFATNLKETKKLSAKVLKAFGALVITVIAVSAAAFFALKNLLPNAAELSGMAIGLYTGGTPNLNAIGSIMGVNSETIALANLSDMFIGSVFYMFLLLLCKPLLKKFLGETPNDNYITGGAVAENVDEITFKGIKASHLWGCFFLALGMCVVGAGIGFLIWILTGSVEGTMTDYLVPALMITVTVLGIISSFSKKIRNVKGTNTLGHYFILVFSFGLAMTFDFDKVGAEMLYVFILYAGITVLSFIVHMLLCKLMKIDVDCAMVTLTAGLYGPAFIPSVTKQINNDKLTAPGLICGSLGYAIGTFLGIGIAYLLWLFV